MSSTFRAALRSRLGRPATDAEVSRAYAMGPAATRLIVATTGPVPPSSHPDQAIAAVAVNMVSRIIETGGVLEFTTEDWRDLERISALYRPRHPFLLAD